MKFVYISKVIYYFLLNIGTDEEIISYRSYYNGDRLNALVLNNYLGGVVRCGIFAASALEPDRIKTGATLYGIMEISYEFLHVDILIPSFDIILVQCIGAFPVPELIKKCLSSVILTGGNYAAMYLCNLSCIPVGLP